jgi:hypothetical protein
MKNNDNDSTNQVNEPPVSYTGFVYKSEEDKLLHDALRIDIKNFSYLQK